MKACKRNGIYKETIESAVINCLIREFSILGYVGSIEEEFRKYQEHINQESIFQLSRITDEINYITKRIQMTKNEQGNAKTEAYAAEFLEELESDLERLKQQKLTLESENKIPVLTKDCVDYAKEKVKTFLISIKRASPEEQYTSLKEFVESITANKDTGGFKLTYKLESPINESGKREILFKKTLYFDTDSKYQLE